MVFSRDQTLESSIPKPRELNPSYSEEQRQISSNILPGHVPPLIQEPVTVQSTTVQEPMVTQATPVEASLPSSILILPSTAPSLTPKRKNFLEFGLKITWMTVIVLQENRKKLRPRALRQTKGTVFFLYGPT